MESVRIPSTEQRRYRLAQQVFQSALDMRHLQQLWRVIISETLEQIIGKQSIWLDLLGPIKLR